MKSLATERNRSPMKNECQKDEINRGEETFGDLGSDGVRQELGQPDSHECLNSQIEEDKEEHFLMGLIILAMFCN